MVRHAVKKSERGFTLTELLVVMATIAVLLLITLIAYRAQIFKGYDARRKTDLHQIKVGLEEYEKDHDCYPSPPLGCGSGTVLEPYMDKVPCDPGTKAPYRYYPESGTTCPGWFWVFTDLDYEEDPGILEVGCLTGCGPTAGETDYNYYTSSTNAPEVFVAPFPFFGCFSGNVCVGILKAADCDPNYNDEASCQAACLTATDFCD